MTSSVQTLPLEPTRRADLGRIITTACQGVTDLLYGLLLCGTRLITMVQPKDSALHLRPSDVLLLINFMTTQPSFKSSETWTPLCLPRFNDKGYLYAYVAYLDPKSDVCLLLILATDDPQQFHVCQKVRGEIDSAMRGERDYFKAIQSSAFEHRVKAVAR